LKPRLLILLALLISMSKGQEFEAVTVKHYDHHSDHIGPRGPFTIFDCHVGPSRLQYNCSGSIPKLMGEALDLQDFQYEERGPEYTLTAKLPNPATRSDMDAMLAKFLKERMGVRYHFEKRSMRAEFLTVVDRELLKKLPGSSDAVPLADVVNGAGRHARWQAFVERQTIRGPDDQERLECKNINFRLLAEMLQLYYRLPIVDDTGTSTRFNLTLVARWDPAEPGAARNFADIKRILSEYGIAIQSRNGLVDFLVIETVGAERDFIN